MKFEVMIHEQACAPVGRPGQAEKQELHRIKVNVSDLPKAPAGDYYRGR